jgi:hypothetical protein
MKEIFISYQHMSGDFVELLSRKLKEKNYVTHWDEDITAGQEWRSEIDTFIRNAFAVIVVMTPEARKSEYVTYEWSVAIGLDKHVIPIMLESTALHPRLEVHHYLDFTTRSGRQWSELFQRLQDIDQHEAAGQKDGAAKPQKLIAHDDLYNLLHEMYFSGIIDMPTLNEFVTHGMLTTSEFKKIRERNTR